MLRIALHAPVNDNVDRRTLPASSLKEDRTGQSAG